MISKSAEYAIRALVFIQLQNQKNNRPGVIEIAREIEAPAAYAAKILQQISKRKLVNSMKGRGGGFFFTEEQENVTLFDIIQIMDGDYIFHKCGFGLKNCSDSNPCPLHNEYKKVRDTYTEIVKNETIFSLAEKISEGKAFLNRISLQ